MNLLQSILLESTWYWAALWFIAFWIVLLLRRRSEPPRARWYLPIWLLAALLHATLSQLIETRREQIWAAANELVAACEQKNHPALARIISPDFQSDGMNRDDFLDYLASALEPIQIRDTRIGRNEIEFSADHALHILGARATISLRGSLGEFHTGRWELRWKRAPDGRWQITALRPLAIDTIDVTTLPELRRLIP